MSQSDFVNRGQALVTSGQYQEAVKVCRLGLLGRPTTVEGRVVLGQALLALKRFDEVLAEMRVALELDHQSIAAHALKGEALLRKGDRHAAIETLERAKTIAPDDELIIRLLTEAERVPGQPMISAAHPAVGYIREGKSSTRNYPNSSDDGEGEDTSDSFTEPTSFSSPQSRRSGKQPIVPAPTANGRPRTPPQAVLDVGDKSGTVEVDPELEGVELDNDELGPPVKPPRSGAAQAQDFEGARGNVSRSRKQKPTQSQRPQGAPMQIVERGSPLSRQPRGQDPVRDSVQELDSDDIEAIDDEPMPQPKNGPGPGTRVREAVGMPSGVIGGRSQAMAAQSGMPQRPGAPPGPSSLAHAIAKAPHEIVVTPVAPAPVVNPRSQIASALPTQAGNLMAPGMPQAPYSPQNPSPAAAMKTMALNPNQMQSANAADQALYGLQQQPQPPQQPQQAPPWARSGGVNIQQLQVDPHGQTFATPDMQYPQAQAQAQAQAQQPSSLFVANPLESGALVAVGEEGVRQSQVPMKTGMRKTRSKLAVVIWILIGGAVIGGGVYAGFYIRAMRLDSQIESAKERAVDQEKPDTWGGWAAARDTLAGIVQASNTAETRAALARARGLVAYEFGDGFADAKAAAEAVKDDGGLDANIAAAYVALVADDAKAAKAAADAAVADSADSGEAQYVLGLAQIDNGDYAAGTKALTTAADKEPRPLHAVGLAHTLAEMGSWDPALAVLDKALKAFPENPAIQIARARILVQAGRVTPTSASAAELRVVLEKIVSEGAKPLADQPRGVSPSQIAFATLAQIRLEYARNNQSAEQAALKALPGVAVDDQRFAEETVDTLYSINELESARLAAEHALAIWPKSRRSAILLSQILVAMNKVPQAIETLAKAGDAMSLPLGLVVRAEAKLASNDVDGARADYASALKRLPGYERALVGSVNLELQAGNVDAAGKLINASMTANATPALTVAYASVLRATNNPASRDKAENLLLKAVKGPPSPDVTRAQLELARIYRDTGKIREARDLYAEASKSNNLDAKIESGLLLFDDAKIQDARNTLEHLYTEVGPHPRLVVEVARARMLTGDHDAASDALDLAAKTPGVTSWVYERERGRLAFRRGDIAGAAQALSHALDSCGPDVETFFLAADVVATDIASADAKNPPKETVLAEKLRLASAKRLKGQPEQKVVDGILALAAGRDDDAEVLYKDAFDTFTKQRAPNRLTARATLGLAIVSYDRRNLPDARNKLDAVIAQDPSSYAAYLFAVEVLKDSGEPSRALAFAKQVVVLDPASVYGWYYVGKLGSKSRDKADGGLLDEAITRINELAPNSDLLRELVSARGR